MRRGGKAKGLSPRLFLFKASLAFPISIPEIVLTIKTMNEQLHEESS
jgi:hypothetical protein